MSQTNISNAKKIAEAADMLAVATVLSLIKILDLPYGGSVTIACMLPVVIIAYRHGVKLGLLTGLVFGIIQQLLGHEDLATTEIYTHLNVQDLRQAILQCHPANKG